MKRRARYLALPVLVSLLGLAACKSGGDKTSESSISVSSSQTSSSQPYSSSADRTPPVIFEDQYGVMLGTFYGTEETLNVTSDRLVLEGERSLDLIPTEVGEVSWAGVTRDAVIYGSEFNSEEYRIHLSFDDKMVLVLERKEGSEFVEVGTFMPSIASFTGAYSSYGDGNVGTRLEVITDTYSPIHDAFIVSDGFPGYLDSGMNQNLFYTKSYFYPVNGEITLMVDYFDYEDDYLYYSMYLTEEDGKVVLYDLLNDWVAFYPDVEFFYDTYFVDEETSISFEYEGGTLDWDTFEYVLPDDVVMDGVDYTFQMQYDPEAGYSYLLTPKEGAGDVRIVPYAYGIALNRGEGFSYYPSDSVAPLEGEYSGEGVDYVYDAAADALTLNSQAVEHTKVNYQGRLGIRVEQDGKELTFLADNPGIAIQVAEDGNTRYLVNGEYFSGLYQGSYCSKNLSEVHDLSVGENYDTTFDGKQVEAHLAYDPASFSADLVLDLDGVEWILSALNEDVGIFSLVNGDGEKIFVDAGVVDSIYDSYTKASKDPDIVITEESITYLGSETDYSIVAGYDPMSFSYFVGLSFPHGAVDILIQYDPSHFLYDYIQTPDENILLDSYISIEDFESLVGTYSFEGSYGVEDFTLTEDGKFYADTLNETGDGLVKDVEMPFHLMKGIGSDGEYVPTIAFEYDGVTVYLYREDAHLVSFGNSYTLDYIFKYRGAYATEDHVIYLVDDTLYLDGEGLELVDYGVDESGNTFLEGTIGGETYRFTFSEKDGVKSVSVESDSLSLDNVPYVDLGLESLVGEYNSEDGTATGTLGKAVDPLTGKTMANYVLTVNGTSYDYVVVYYEGHLSLKFSDGLNTYYLYRDGEEVVLVHEGTSIPLPPPPPPAPTL